MRSLIDVKAGWGSQSLMENKTSHLESFNEPATFSKYLFSSLVIACPNNSTSLLYFTYSLRFNWLCEPIGLLNPYLFILI